MKWLSFLDHDFDVADPDMGELPHFSLCVFLSAVEENLDPVVFPMLFLVKWSWLRSSF
jgi:hypothetical protein